MLFIKKEVEVFVFIKVSTCDFILSLLYVFERISNVGGGWMSGSLKSTVELS